MVFITVFNGFHGYHALLCIKHSRAMQIIMEQTKAWHDKGMEWHDEAWRGCDKLLQNQKTETGKIKKKAPDVSEPGT